MSNEYRREIVKAWLEGWRVLIRLLRFMVWLWVAQIPLALLGLVFVDPSHGAPADSRFAGAREVYAIVSIVYIPLASYFAAKQSGQLRGIEGSTEPQPAGADT